VKAAVLRARDAPFVVEDVALDPCADDEVVVRTGGAAFCITDCHMQHGHLPVGMPAILGHSAVGVVEQAGPRVERVRVGQRVIVPATPECGRCYFCVRHRSDQCVRLVGAPPRFVGTLSDGTPVRAGGTATYAEQIKVPEVFAFGVDSDLPDEQLALMGCGVVSGLGAVMRVAEVQPGSSVVVVGAGHLGLWMVQGARVAGASQIIVVEPIAERRALAGSLGATDLVDPSSGDAIEQVRELTGGRGADYALEAAGRIDAMEQAFHMARNAGTVVYTGVQTMDSTITFPAVMLALRGRTVRSCQSGNTWMSRDIPLFARMIEQGLVDPKPIISRTYALDEINDAARASEERRDLTGVVLPGIAAGRPAA
jgi:S-(hydroxymethyl)glutathione dehydrogenase / alcohol dehydrogenase